MTAMFVKPNPNKKRDGKIIGVYDPVHKKFMPETGAQVPASPYWAERLRQGDIVYATNDVPNDKDDLSKMTKEQLLARAEHLGLTTVKSSMKKDDIIKEIQGAESVPPSQNATQPMPTTSDPENEHETAETPQTTDGDSESTADK